MRFLLLILLVFNVGCVSRPQSDFDNAEDFVKTISDGLYFIREVTSGTFWEEKDLAKLNWDRRASEVCLGSGYRSLLEEDGNVTFSITSVAFVGGLPIFYGVPGSLPVVDGVILCNSSQLSEEQAIQILKDEMYILPKNA